VACGFVIAAIFAAKEMKRREALGLLKGQPKQLILDHTNANIEILLYSILSFVIFFKLVGIIEYQPELRTGDLQFKDFLQSIKLGSFGGGIIAALTTAAISLYKRKQQPLKVETKIVTVYPSDNIGDLVVIAAVLGIIGAAFFNYLENPQDYTDFSADPLGSLFSGLSVFGGLIFAGTGFIAYAYWKKFSILHFVDSVAPGFILANGIGRIGCHVAGDGDWGIANPYIKPTWFPDFLWSNHYAYHIIECDPLKDVPIANCVEIGNCCQLAQAAYPTPLYELIMCTFIFVILWFLRKPATLLPGMLFSVFMVLIGIQRLLIEQWRDLSGRETYIFLNADFRQSEIVSIVMMLTGITICILLWRKYKIRK
jgi:prolipoprotein diacylglyceryltransferase